MYRRTESGEFFGVLLVIAVFAIGMALSGNAAAANPLMRDCQQYMDSRSDSPPWATLKYYECVQGHIVRIFDKTQKFEKVLALGIAIRGTVRGNRSQVYCDGAWSVEPPAQGGTCSERWNTLMRLRHERSEEFCANGNLPPTSEEKIRLRGAEAGYVECFNRALSRAPENVWGLHTLDEFRGLVKKARGAVAGANPYGEEDALLNACARVAQWFATNRPSVFRRHSMTCDPS